MHAPGGGDMRFGAGIWLFGQFVDRYAADAYGPPVNTLEAIERAGSVGSLEVLDINYPFSDPDIGVAEVQRALDAAGLRAASITPHLYMREFVRGAFTNPHPALPRRAPPLFEEAGGAAPPPRAPAL